MGCWDIFCFICGNPCHSAFDDVSKKMVKDTQWMNKCSILLEDNKVIHGVKEMNCNTSFCKKNKCYEHMSPASLKTKEPNGFFIHTDCWKYIKDKYNIKLKFGDLPPYKLTYTTIFDINYGDIENYWEQNFNFSKIVSDKKEYLCSSPLKNDKNISQIKKNFSIETIK